MDINQIMFKCVYKTTECAQAYWMCDSTHDMKKIRFIPGFPAFTSFKETQCKLMRDVHLKSIKCTRKLKKRHRRWAKKGSRADYSVPKAATVVSASKDVQCCLEGVLLVLFVIGEAVSEKEGLSHVVYGGLTKYLSFKLSSQLLGLWQTNLARIVSNELVILHCLDNCTTRF
jgi:hypothetical protein